MQIDNIKYDSYSLKNYKEKTVYKFVGKEIFSFSLPEKKFVKIYQTVEKRIILFIRGNRTYIEIFNNLSHFKKLINFHLRIPFPPKEVQLVITQLYLDEILPLKEINIL